MKRSPAFYVLFLMVILYIGYFSVFTVLRIRALYAHYYDLGIMHQAVYNTYQALRTFDWSRVLEISNPHGAGFVKRMAVHNDMLLAFLSPFYFIYSGPQTLVVLQTVILGLGALAIYGICREALGKTRYTDAAGLVFAFAYLMYVPMQRANMFDFHAVALATSLILFMFYFWLKKKYVLSYAVFAITLLTKENIGLTTFLLGAVMLVPYLKNIWKMRGKKEVLFPIAVMTLSVVWVALSMFVIIPFFRGSQHFAIARYSVVKDPAGIPDYIFHKDTYPYLLNLFGPLSFLPLFSPLHLSASVFEFAINLLSDSWNMRNIIHHYTSVIQPVLFIAAVYGFRNVTRFLKRKGSGVAFAVLAAVVCSTLVFSYLKGPLPFALGRDVHPFLYPAGGYREAAVWADRLKSESISVCSTGHLAPLFASRRHYYHFAVDYEKADYVVLQKNEIYNYFDREADLPAHYERLKADKMYSLIYKSSHIEVFRKQGAPTYP